MKVVVSQPMFFPWIGLFEQIQLADTYVHLDDVQMPGGSSFMHRVQLKGASGAFWWSLPLKKRSISALISDVEIAPSQKWIQKSQHSLEQILSGLPFRNESIDIFLEVIEKNFNTLSQFNKYSIELISKYLSIETVFKDVKRDIIHSDKTVKLLQLLKAENTKTYISGTGGKQYLKHKLFEQNNIDLQFMDYKNHSYVQNYGDFSPYVSILHPIATLGRNARDLLISQAI